MRLHQRIRRGKLQGEQLDITFPRRGRPSRFRRLERAGQMTLDLTKSASRANSGTSVRVGSGDESSRQVAVSDAICSCLNSENLQRDLNYLFPVGPMSEDQLAAEFNRLFPPE